MNGFSNWATWNVALWFDNSENLYKEKRHWAARTLLTAERVEAFVREKMPNGTPDMASAKELDAVDWDELNANWTWTEDDQNNE